jgi:hypothetical protein
VADSIIMAGDYNCVTFPSETTGAPIMSRALTSLLRGLGLTDTREGDPRKPTYTHYTSGGASQIDRIYITEYLRASKQGAAIIPAAFTDHLAVTVRMSLDHLTIPQRECMWRVNTSLLGDDAFTDRLQEQWMKWV